MKILRSFSSRETSELGANIAKKIFATGPSQAGSSKKKKRLGVTVLALQGDLGAGKTTFVQGFARGLGIKRRMASPTFIIMRRFTIAGGGKNIKFKNFYHIDAYRLKELDLLEPLGLREIFADPSSIVLVEWPEKIKKILPRQTIWLKFRHGKKENERTITGSDILN